LYDVIVIGGGPVGSYLAGRLAEKGRNVLILERKQRVGDSVCCTGIIGLECARMFNINEKTLLRQVNSAKLYSPSGNELRLRREEDQACILDRVAFDICMAEQAEEKGARISLSSRVKDVILENDGVRAEVSCRGKESTIRARSAVIATGFGSGLCKRLGLGGFRDATIGAQAEVEAPGVDEVEVYFGDVAPGFFAWLVPTIPPFVRVGLLARRNPGFHLIKWLAFLESEGKIRSSKIDIIYGGIPLKPLAKTHGERLVVVGDAAGQVKPTSGGGIYYGLLCADIAVRTLHQALEDDDLSAGRLARYERAWRKKLGRELRIGYWTRKLYERLSNRQVDRIFKILKDNAIDEALLEADDLSFDWHSRTILRLVGYRMVARAVNVFKLPFKTG
jgi:geranylgeranyl reductase family protein